MEESKEENSCCAEEHSTQGLGWRVSLSIIVGVAWLVFLLVWFFFYAGMYNWEKNVAIVLFSLLVIVGILGIPWSIWGLRHRTEEEQKMWKTHGFSWRVWVSGFFVVAVFVFLIYWFWYLAQPYLWYHNLIIFVVAFLIIGGILGAMWAPWGIKYGHHNKEKKKE
ncbi:MAG: hypothetical protein V1726_05965 [Methanobacteriota archaeon]